MGSELPSKLAWDWDVDYMPFPESLPAQQVQRQVEHLTAHAAESHEDSLGVVEAHEPALVVRLLHAEGCTSAA